jgi:hypothetical protein
MDTTHAKFMLANLVERIELDENGKYHLPGVLTRGEVTALQYAQRVVAGATSPPRTFAKRTGAPEVSTSAPVAPAEPSVASTILTLKAVKRTPES